MAFSDTGDFSKTGLPLLPRIFAAYNLLTHNLENVNEGFRYGFSTRLACTLAEHGQRDENVLAAAILSPMPADLDGVISRRVSAEVAKLVGEHRRHTETSYAYIDEASPQLMQLAAAALMNAMASVERSGQALLDRLADPEVSMALAMGQAQLNLPAMPPARIYQNAAEALSGKTGNPALENALLLTADAYAGFRDDYHRQLLATGIMPPKVQMHLYQQLEKSRDYPPFENTGILDTPELAAIYDFVCKDGRITAAHVGAAISIADIMTTGNADTDAIAAAFLSQALPAIKPADIPFLEKRFGAEIINLMQAAQLPLTGMENAQVLQINMARGCVLLDGCLVKLAQIEKGLASGNISDHARLPFFMQNAAPLMETASRLEDEFDGLRREGETKMLDDMLRRRILGVRARVRMIGKTVGFDAEAGQAPPTIGTPKGPNL